MNKSERTKLSNLLESYLKENNYYLMKYSNHSILLNFLDYLMDNNYITSEEFIDIKALLLNENDEANIIIFYSILKTKYLELIK